MPAPTRLARQIALVPRKRAKLSGEFTIPTLKRSKLLEISLTPAKSVTSQFLIDKNSPIFAFDAPNGPFSTSPTPAISNRNTKKLESPVSHRKQSTGQFLIATFRALFSPGQAHFAFRFSTK
ncbi:MAG TPA: hypothetical protein VJP87_14035 [Candidatus Acidoferrales bacterium]|nr:hypothetical protein [Candidatus Acidoferrales bacterium]